MGRSSKDRRDIFYRLAKEEGWRARSAFKLLHIDSYFNIFDGVTRAVDLCAAPGSWSQVLAQQLRKNNSYIDKKKSEKEMDKDSGNECGGGEGLAPEKIIEDALGGNAVTTEGAGEAAAPPETYIVAVDLQTMSPIPGVICLKGDITEEKTAMEVIKNLGNSKAQLVVCDGAPDVTGWHGMDEFLQAQLLYSALNIATLILEEGGTFVAKFFRASALGVETVYSRLILFFEEVTIAKPRSSRSTSIESFVVCRNFNLPADFISGKLIKFAEEFHGMDLNNPNPQMRDKIIKFVACGDLDGYDADTTYPFHGVSLPPVQPPIDPPYAEAVRRRKAGLNRNLDLSNEEIKAKEKQELEKSKHKPPKQKIKKCFIPKTQEQIDAEEEEIDAENETANEANEKERIRRHKWLSGSEPNNPEAMYERRRVALEKAISENPKYETKRKYFADLFKRRDELEAAGKPSDYTTILEEFKQNDMEAYKFLARLFRRGCETVYETALEYTDESEDEFPNYEYLKYNTNERRDHWIKRLRKGDRKARHWNKYSANPLNFNAKEFKPEREEFKKLSDEEKVAAYRAAAEAGMKIDTGRYLYPFEFGEEDKDTEEYKIERWIHAGSWEPEGDDGTHQFCKSFPARKEWGETFPSSDELKQLFCSHPAKTHLHGARIKIFLSFGGGAEKLVGDIREKEIMMPAPRMDYPNHKHTMKMLIKWIKNNLIVERPELFVTEDGNVRPGILVLINDMDWELLGNVEYWLAENDRVSFISTLHGG